VQGLKRGLKRIVKNILYYRPRGIKSCGKDSYILRPRKITGAQHIEIGERTVIYRNSWLNAIDTYVTQKFHPRMVFGNDVYVGQYACIVAAHDVEIEDGCVLSEHVYVSDCGHGTDPEKGLIMRQPLFHKGKVKIGAHSFIGYGARILPGVTLGHHCIVGANTVVTKSFPEYSMVVGMPAVLVKRYSAQTKSWVPVSQDEGR